MSSPNMRDSALVLSAVSLVCLLGVGLAVSWTAAVVVIVVGSLVWLGYWLAAERLSVVRERVQRERAALDAEWKALDQTRRVREVFFDARRTMAEEAQRYWPNNPEHGDQR